MPRTLRTTFHLLVLVLFVTAGHGADLADRTSSPAAADRLAAIAGRPQMQTAAPTGRIVLLTADGATADDRLRITALAAAPLEPRLDAAALADLTLRAAKRGRAADRLAGLERWLQIDAGHLDRQAQLQLVRRLLADPAVVTAFLEPRAVPAALGFDAFTGEGPAAAAVGPQSVATTTPDFTEYQGSLWLAPQGIGAWAMRDQPGARGGSVRIVDIEGAWLWAHEDLPAPFLDLGQHIANLAWRNHGTAVAGQLVGLDNGSGIDGIVPDCLIGASSVGNQSVPAAMLNAAQHLAPGDLILIELHGAGPNAYEGGGQYGYVPMEFWPDVFAVTRALVDLGLIVVAAAGNGEQNLDHPLYLGLFDREVRDSGAILVGATAGSSPTPAWFTNHGSRVDLSGWGMNVATTGYGDLQSGPETAWYTLAFSGTSSASPIVTGAVASLQGMVEAAFGFRLEAYLAREILRQAGTPTDGPAQVGPRPDLVAAWALAGQGIGFLAGTVTELGSGLPLGGVTVRATPGGAVTATAGDGTYALSLLPGTYDLQFSAYFHETRLDAVAVTAGANAHAAALAPLPLAAVTGTVLGAAQQALGGARLVWSGEPLPAVHSEPDGSFTMPAIPASGKRLLLAGGIAGHGGTAVTVAVQAGAQDVVVVLPAVTHDFADGAEGFTATGGLWQLGDPSVAGAGPGAAFSGPFCWGVGMDGQGYPDEALAELWSPLYTAEQFAGDRLHLSFHYWSGTETGYDGVHVVLEVAGATNLIHPLEPYTDLFLGGLGHQSGWSGSTGGWRTAIFDLTAQLAEPSWRFALRFGSDVFVTETGFFVDGFTLQATDVTTGAEDGLPAAPELLLAAWPNPFNPRLNLAWSLPEPAEADLAVFDLRGRLVRRLLQGGPVAARGSLVWDGRDQTDRAVASGIYLVRLQSVGVQAVQRITLAR